MQENVEDICRAAREPEGAGANECRELEPLV